MAISCPGRCLYFSRPSELNGIFELSKISLPKSCGRFYALVACSACITVWVTFYHGENEPFGVSEFSTLVRRCHRYDNRCPRCSRLQDVCCLSEVACLEESSCNMPNPRDKRFLARDARHNITFIHHSLYVVVGHILRCSDYHAAPAVWHILIRYLGRNMAMLFTSNLQQKQRVMPTRVRTMFAGDGGREGNFPYPLVG